MYQKRDRQTKTLFPELFPLGGALREDNRWIKLSRLIPWEELETVYEKYFSKKEGRPAKDSRLMCGLLIVKHWEGYSDVRVVEEFLENPYVQALCGYETFVTVNVLHPSLLTKTRKRLGKEFFKKFEEEVLGVLIKKRIVRGKGHFLDATVIPANITHPTDTKILNRCREWVVEVIGQFRKKANIVKKIRTYCRVAKKAYFNFQKKRKKTKAQIHKMRGYLLRKLRRNVRQLEEMLKGYGRKLKGWEREFIRTRLKMVKQIYEQQRELWKTKGRSIKERVVSLHLPHIRPIVRGKDGKPTEFGPKALLSWVDGICFLDLLGFENYNEGGHLLESLKKYRERFKKWPKDSTGDGIFGTRANRELLQRLKIRGGFKALGRASQKQTNRQWLKKQQKRRGSLMEGIIGHGKNNFGLDKILYRMAGGEEMWIRMGLLSMNLNTAIKRI